MKAPPRARLTGFTLIEHMAVIAINPFAIKEWKFAIVVHPIFMVAGNGLTATCPVLERDDTGVQLVCKKSGINPELD